MSDSLANLSRRLAKVEREAAKRARRKELANCNCEFLMVAVAKDPEEFEAEMNRTCPAHGFRYLGPHLIRISFINRDKTETEKSLKLKALVDAYCLRLSQNSLSRLRHENDSE